MTDRYECIFCQTKCESLEQLKEHSGECQKHPLHVWKEAVTDAAIVRWVYTEENENDPRKIINDLLYWEQKVALDPTVSEDAKKLHDRIKELEDDLKYASGVQWD